MKLAVPLLFLTSPLLAQGTEMITGQVLLNDRPPGPLASMVQVELQLSNRPGEPMRATVNAEGEYRFVNLGVGQFTVAARAPGYKPAKSDVETMGGNQTRGSTRLVLVSEQALPKGASAGPVVISQNELRAPKKAVKEIEAAEKALGAGDLDGASRDLDKALALYPNYARASFLRGTVFEKQHKLEEAVRSYQKAIQDNPSHLASYRALADLHRANLDFASLDNIVAQWKSVQPLEAAPYLYAAVSQYERGNYPLAVEQGLLASRLPHDHLPDLKLILANCYNKLRNREAAAQQLREFLERWPNHPLSSQVRSSLEALQESRQP